MYSKIRCDEYCANFSGTKCSLTGLAKDKESQSKLAASGSRSGAAVVDNLAARGTALNQG